MKSSLNHKLTVGVIGGMGPAATLDLFKKILEITPANCDEEHLNIQIDNNPIPGAKRDPLCERARRLEACGADFIVIPCNAAHEHYAAVQASVNIPVINMIHETVQAVIKTQPGITRVGVLAWHETLRAALYQNMLQKNGLVAMIPEENEWWKLIDLINAVKSGRADEKKMAVVSLGKKLIAAGAQAIILGCTELPLVLSKNDFPVPVFDATYILASTAVNVALRRTTFDDLGFVKAHRNVQGGDQDHNP
jgi:aspartate racemase